MSNTLQISIGQYSDKGRKPENQDFHGVRVPEKTLLAMKGAADAMAAGASSSDVSQVASEIAVKSFLEEAGFRQDLQFVFILVKSVNEVVISYAVMIPIA